MSDENKYLHLSKNAREALSLTKEERIEKIRSDRWIGYTQARTVLDKLEDLLSYPQRHRMPCLLLVGDTNNGKTMIARRFLNLHPVDLNLNGDAMIAPVVLVQAPPVPDEGRFYNNILHRLFVPYKESDRASKKLAQVISILSAIRVRVLIIDEIHDILAGSIRKQQEFLNVIKHLSNELMIPIVGVGTRDALRAIQTDPQIANRFEPIILPRWKMDEEYLRLLASYERVLPLEKPSNLTNTEVAQKLLSMSEGIIGELSRILTIAAVEAVYSGKEMITLDTLKHMNWIRPSDRRKYAETES